MQNLSNLHIAKHQYTLLMKIIFKSLSYKTNFFKVKIKAILIYKIEIRYNNFEKSLLYRTSLIYFQNKYLMHVKNLNKYFKHTNIFDKANNFFVLNK